MRVSLRASSAPSHGGPPAPRREGPGGVPHRDTASAPGHEQSERPDTETPSPGWPRPRPRPTVGAQPAQLLVCTGRSGRGLTLSLRPVRSHRNSEVPGPARPTNAQAETALEARTPRPRRVRRRGSASCAEAAEGRRPKKTTPPRILCAGACGPPGFPGRLTCTDARRLEGPTARGQAPHAASRPLRRASPHSSRSARANMLRPEVKQYGGPIPRLARPQAAGHRVTRRPCTAGHWPMQSAPRPGDPAVDGKTPKTGTYCRSKVDQTILLLRCNETLNNTSLEVLSA